MSQDSNYSFVRELVDEILEKVYEVTDDVDSEPDPMWERYVWGCEVGSDYTTYEREEDYEEAVERAEETLYPKRTAKRRRIEEWDRHKKGQKFDTDSPRE